MYIIAGLGNPTAQYKGTRHNVGFEVIDYLADKYNIDVTTKKFKGLIATGVVLFVFILIINFCVARLNKGESGHA